MLKRVPIKSQDVRVGDMLFVDGIATAVLDISKPFEVMKFPARTAITNRGEVTLYDGDESHVLQYEIEGLIYADKASHDADLANNRRAFVLQVQHANPSYI